VRFHHQQATTTVHPQNGNTRYTIWVPFESHNQRRSTQYIRKRVMCCYQTLPDMVGDRKLAYIICYKHGRRNDLDHQLHVLHCNIDTCLIHTLNKWEIWNHTMLLVARTLSHLKYMGRILGCIWERSMERILEENYSPAAKRFFQSEVIICWFCEVIFWNELRGWELKKVASSDSVKWFSIVILRVYAKKSKRIIFSLRITSPENQGAQLCQTDP
jgi:hypothetical protein